MTIEKMVHAVLLFARNLQLNIWISSVFFSRGPGGRGPWPNPNTNSVSYILLHLYLTLWLSVFTITVSHVLFHLGSILSTDSLFIFISRQLCGKCPVMDSCLTVGHKLPVMRWYLTGTPPSRCTQRSFLFSSLASPLRALQGEAAHQELPSCLAPEVSYTL